MADDLRKLAADAKAAHEKKQQDQRKEAQDRQAARDKAVAGGIKLLDSEVHPVLIEAVDAFSETGVVAKIEKLYDVASSYVEPSIKFWCESRPRRDDGYRYQSLPLFVSSDGAEIKVGLGSFHSDRFPKDSLGTVKPGLARDLIVSGTKRVIEAYYREVANIPGLSA
jgi:hypothetical protein